MMRLLSKFLPQFSMPVYRLG